MLWPRLADFSKKTFCLSRFILQFWGVHVFLQKMQVRLLNIFFLVCYKDMFENSQMFVSHLGDLDELSAAGYEDLLCWFSRLASELLQKKTHWSVGSYLQTAKIQKHYKIVVGSQYQMNSSEYSTNSRIIQNLIAMWLRSCKNNLNTEQNCLVLI